MSSQRNFYEILNTTPAAGIDELRNNYKQLILQCHPDKLHHNNSTNCSANAPTVASASDVGVDLNAESAGADMSGVFVAINEAWNTLKDPAKRRLYDAELLLTKFQMHSNIYARLTFSDMKRVSATVRSSGSESDNDGVYEESDAERSRKSETAKVPTADAAAAAATTATSYYYAYDCRCGGQYIVDESVDSEILNHNQKCSNCSNDVHNCAGADSVAAGSEGGCDGDDDVIVECSECSLVIVLH